MKSTQELEQEIRESTTPEVLLGGDFHVPSFPIYLNSLLHNRNLTVQDVVVGCHLDRNYSYQLFNGTRRPTRDFLLRLALWLHLSEGETQRLLKLSGREPLYARNRRDATLLYALTHGLTAEDVGELLDSMDEDALI